MPETIQNSFVQTVVCCRIGNGYGVSNAAVPYYDEMIKSFSPREVATLINKAVDRSSTLGRRVEGGGNCRRNLKAVLELIDAASVPSTVKPEFDRLVR